MSLAYVTIAEAKNQVRVVQSDTLHDSRLNQLIGAASGVVKNFLGDFSAYEGERNDDDDYILDDNGEPVVDTDGGKEIREEVKMAVLLLIDRWFNGDLDGFDVGLLPPDITAILWPIRDPALA